MTKQQIEKIVALFPGVLYMKGEDIYFCHEDVYKNPCRLWGHNINTSFSIMPKSATQHMMVMVLSADLSAIESCFFQANPQVFYYDLFSIETQLSFFRLGIDISYMPVESRKMLYFDRIGILRKYTLNNIIND